MAEKKVPAWVENNRAMARELSEAKKAAGIWRDSGRQNSEAERGWRAQIGMAPVDTRTLTGILMGDPVKNDPRAPWRG